MSIDEILVFSKEEHVSNQESTGLLVGGQGHVQLRQMCLQPNLCEVLGTYYRWIGHSMSRP